MTNPNHIDVKARSTATSDTQLINLMDVLVPNFAPLNADGSTTLLTNAGTPTGTPAAGTIVYDTTAHKIWVYDGGWKYAALT